MIQLNILHVLEFLLKQLSNLFFFVTKFIGNFSRHIENYIILGRLPWFIWVNWSFCSFSTIAFGKIWFWETYFKRLQSFFYDYSSIEIDFCQKGQRVCFRNFQHESLIPLSSSRDFNRKTLKFLFYSKISLKVFLTCFSKSWHYCLNLKLKQYEYLMIYLLSTVEQTLWVSTTDFLLLFFELAERILRCNLFLYFFSRCFFIVFPPLSSQHSTMFEFFANH